MPLASKNAMLEQKLRAAVKIFPFVSRWKVSLKILFHQHLKKKRGSYFDLYILLLMPIR